MQWNFEIPQPGMGYQGKLAPAQPAPESRFVLNNVSGSAVRAENVFAKEEVPNKLLNLGVRRNIPKPIHYGILPDLYQQGCITRIAS